MSDSTNIQELLDILEADCLSKEPINDESSGVNLSPPYATRYGLLKSFFADDPDYTIGNLDDETRTCSILVHDKLKYDLLKKYLRTSFEEDGNIGLHIDIVSDGGFDDFMTEKELAAMLSTNKFYDHIYSSEEGPFKFDSVVFKNKAVSFYNDDIFSEYKMDHMLPTDVVGQLFKNDVFTEIRPENK